MTKVEIKPNQQYICYKCDKPYIIKGALTNHLRKVHKITKSPTKKDLMDISTNSDSDINDTVIQLDDVFEAEKTAILEQAKDLDRKEEADELQIILGMTSTMSFDTSVLTRASEAEEPTNGLTILSNAGMNIIGEPLTTVPLCSPAAKFMSESQRKILIPDILESEEEDVELQEKYNCDVCKETFSNSEESTKHKKGAHEENNHSAGDHKCEECSYRTNIAANYLKHFLNNHITDEFANTINNLKPVDSAVVYILAEQNMGNRRK